MSPDIRADLFFSRAKKIGRPISLETAYARVQDCQMVAQYRKPDLPFYDWPLPGYARDALRRILPFTEIWTSWERRREVCGKLDAADRAATSRRTFGCRIPGHKPVGNARGFQTKAGWRRVA